MITKNKLNALFNSRLNPEITSRAELSQTMSIAESTIGKWFSTINSQGSPKDPVVPKRHEGRLAELFGIKVEAFAQDEEAFQFWCYELAQQRRGVPAVDEATVEDSEEETSREPLPRRNGWNRPALIASFSVLVIALIGLLFILPVGDNSKPGGALLSDYQQLLELRIQEITQELAKTDSGNSVAHSALNFQLQELQNRLDDIDTFYKSYQYELAAQSDALNSLRDSLSYQQLAEAQAATRNGDFAKSNAALETLVNRAEKNLPIAAEAAYILGNNALVALQFNNAISYLEKAVTMQPDAWLYKKGLADVYFALNDFDQAERFYLSIAPAKAINLSSYSSSESATETQLSIDNLGKQSQLFVERLSAQVLADPKHIEVRSHILQQLGHIAIQKGQHEQVLHYLNGALAVIDRSQSAELYQLTEARLNITRGYLAGVQGHYHRALAEFQQAVKAELGDSDNAKAVKGYGLIGIASSYKQLGDSELAYSYAQQALEFNLQHFHRLGFMVGRTHWLLGDIHRWRKNFDQAEKHYQMLQAAHAESDIQRDSFALSALNGLGYVNIDRQQFQTALDYFDQAEKLNPRATEGQRSQALETYVGQGQAWLLLSNPVSSLVAFEQANRTVDAMRKPLEPWAAAAKFGLARNLQVFKQYPRAADLYEESLKLLAQMPDKTNQGLLKQVIYEGLADAINDLDKNASSPSSFSKMEPMENLQQLPLAAHWLLLGDFNYRLERWEQARAAYQKGENSDSVSGNNEAVYSIYSTLSLGRVSMAENNHTQAAQFFTNAVDLSQDKPNHPLSSEAKTLLARLNGSL